VKKLVILIAVVVMMLGLSMPAHAFFLNFENGYGRNGQTINDIPGVSFIVTGGYPWIYGDSSTNLYNTRSIDLGTSWNQHLYQHYGNVFAYLSTASSANQGKIDFTNNDGTLFRTGYTSSSNFYLEGYDTNGIMIASASGGGNLSQTDMGWLTINAPTGQYFDYVMIHDTGNYFLVDNMSGDATGVGDVIPEPATLSLLGFGLLGLAGLRKKRS
jgi:hypothetical protein